MWCTDGDAFTEDIELGELDLAQEAEVDRVHDLRSEKRETLMLAELHPCLEVILAGTGCFEFHQVDQWKCVIAGKNISLGDSEAAHIFFRQIDSSHCRIFFYVAQNIR